MLALVTVVTPGTAHSKTLVKCNFCDMKFSAITSRLAAHFAKRSGFNVRSCKQPTPEAVALGKKHLDALDKARDKKRQRDAEKSMGRSRQIFLRRKNDGEGEDAADRAFARMLIATGQSCGLVESAFFRDFVASVVAYPEWQPRQRTTIATTDLDAEYERVSVESTARLERNGLSRGKALRTDGLTTKQVRAHRTQTSRKPKIPTSRAAAAVELFFFSEF